MARLNEPYSIVTKGQMLKPKSASQIWFGARSCIGQPWWTTMATRWRGMREKKKGGGEREREWKKKQRKRESKEWKKDKRLIFYFMFM